MPLPLTDPDTLLEELLQDLPPETVQMARACKAFVRAKQVKTPGQLLRVVCFYCGVDKSLREVAGTLTALDESMTAQAVAERWRACGPWVQARRRRMLPLSAVPPRPQGRRFVVSDASRRPAPGATGTAHRRHIAMDVVALQLLAVFVRDVHTGETRQPFPVAPGDSAVADRGDAQGQGMRAALQQGADLIVRLPPCRVVLRDAGGGPLERCAALKRQPTHRLRPLAVERCATGAQPAGRGWGHASRLNAEQAHRARPTGRQGHTQGTPTAESLLVAGGVVVCPPLTPAVLAAQTILALYRCRWQGDLAIKRWKRVREVDAVRAKAPRPLAAGWLQGTLLSALRLERRLRRQLGASGGRRAPERVGTWWRVGGMLPDALAPIMTGALCWQEDAWAACLKV